MIFIYSPRPPLLRARDVGLRPAEEVARRVALNDFFFFLRDILTRGRVLYTAAHA
ncbi:MAG: hypothetical protein N2378_14440 [Chloroflexaceae bacterium]|nr:hypothetical protein [Chloroflexaceae bacterium]